MTKAKETNALRIYFLGRGFVIAAFDADAETRTEDEVKWVRIKKGTTIRDWGTNKGIGQLVIGGPRRETKLDAIPHEIDVPVAAIHMRLKCTDESRKLFVKEIDKAEKELLK